MRPETVLLPGDQLKLGVEAGVAGEADQTPEQLTSRYRCTAQLYSVQYSCSVIQYSITMYRTSEHWYV